MPLESQLHIDTLLSQVSVKYKNEDHVGREIFPVVPVKKSSDLYRVYERNFRIPETKRSHKASAREHNFMVSTASYSLVRHALKDYVADHDADNYDLADLRAEVTEELTEKILMRFEKDVAAIITTTSWSLNLTLAAAAAWNATTTVDPVLHFDTGTVSVVNNSAQTPNIAAMGLAAWFAFKNNFQILDRIKYTSQEVGYEIAAALIGAEKLVVSKMAEDTADEGQSTGANIVALWNDRVFWGYRPAAAGPLKPSAGYTFQKPLPIVKRWREESREADAIEVNMEHQVKVVASLSGFIIADVT